MTASIINDEYQTVPVDALTEHPKNARHGDIGAVIASIEAHGFFGALVVQRSTGYILAGNHRYRAATQIGLLEVPVTYVDVDDETALRILIADNRTSDLGTYDDSALATLLQELAATERGLDGVGYDGDDLDELLADLGLESNRPAGAAGDPEPTAADAAQKKWKVNIGDVWEAGAHTVVCGDSTDPGAYHVSDVNAMWTDPPYGVNYEDAINSDGTKRRSDAISNDTEGGIDELLSGVLANAVGVLSAGAPWYVTAPPGPLLQRFMHALDAHGLRQTLIWIKQNAVFGRSDYHYQHEPILYGWKPGAAHAWHGDRKQTSILQHDRPHKSPLHPTTKPVSLVVQCLSNSATSGDSVIDPFLGSGTTLLACEHLGMRGYGIEIDPKFVAVALQRLVDIGLTPERKQ